MITKNIEYKVAYENTAKLYVPVINDARIYSNSSGCPKRAIDEAMRLAQNLAGQYMQRGIRARAVQDMS